METPYNIVISILTLFVIPLAKHWINKEGELQKDLAKARKQERDALFKQVNDKLIQHDEQLKDGVSRFKELEGMLAKINIGIAEIKVILELFTKEKLK
jgi:hypothetical protein